MDIKFKELKIENFMSIGDALIDLSDRGFTLIEGVNNNISDNARSNGSGKSSIFEALVWVLTGNTVRGNKDIVNYNGTDGALVTLTFIVDNDKFVITRTKEHSKHKTNLFIEINGVDKSGKGIKDSEKLLSEYLPDLTSSLIGSVIVLGQGLPQKFSANTPSGRKEVLEKLFKSDFMIQDLKNRISTRKAELSDDLRRVQDNKLIANTKLEGINEFIEVATKRLAELNEVTEYEIEANMLKEKVAESEEKLLQLTDKLETYKEKLSQHIATQYELRNQKLQLLTNVDNEYLEQINNIQTDINNTEVELRLKKSELDRVRNITDVCPTCGQKLPDVHKPNIDEYVKNYELALDKNTSVRTLLLTVQKEIEQKKLTITSQLDNDMAVVDNEVKDVSEEVESIKLSIEVVKTTLSKDKKRLDEKLSFQETRLFEMKSLSESLEKNEVLRDNLKIDIKEYEAKESELNDRLSIITKFNTAVTRDFRGYLLNDVIVYINKRAKEYCKYVFNTDLIEFTLDGNNLLISYNNKEYEALSGGERQKVDLIIQFAIRDMLCRHASFSSNIIVMDEIFDNLDDVGCQKVLDLITTKLYDISSIFIITHHGSELNVPYDNVIRIEKDNNGITKVV